MNADSITRVAALIGEAGRIQMLTVLLDGNGHPASELAVAAAVSPQTASSHLSKLLGGGLVVCERQGRQRFFRLKNHDVAAAIEALGALAQPRSPAIPEIRFARSCYDHLAGVLAIALRNQLMRKDVFRRAGTAFTLTRSGERFFASLHIDIEPLRHLRRSFARPCLDWTERHPHVGGAVGAALLSRMFEMKWLARIRETRALRLTQAGERGFEEVFEISSAVLCLEHVGTAASAVHRAKRDL